MVVCVCGGGGGHMFDMYNLFRLSNYETELNIERRFTTLLLFRLSTRCVN